jgi:AbrB family looped-hinge helix DNA binding protein
MRTTIDRAGRIVIPKPIREDAGLAPGTEVEVQLRDGRVEIEPVSVPRRLVRRRGRLVLEPQGDVPPLTDDDVRDILERIRR